MGAKLRLENSTSTDIQVQVELTGVVATVQPLSEVVIDADFEDSEKLHIQLKSDRVVVWGGVAAKIVNDSVDE